MSDLLGARQLKPATCQLPVAWYFDDAVFAEEKKLFEAGPNYVGHELMVPAPGDYQTLAWMDHAKVLVRNAGGVELLSNVCRHRQSIMLEGRGRLENIVCPLHRWTYDLKGELLGAPHFPESPCVKLASTPLTHWNGLLFAGTADPHAALAGMDTSDWDFSGYVLDRVMVDEYEMNWKTFIEVYLEVYHVDPLPSGPRQLHRLQPVAGALRGGLVGAGGAGQERPGQAGHARVPQVARGLPEAPRGARAQAGRAVDDLVPGVHAGVVSERADREPAHPALAHAYH
jgi:nitrite reductase/ring-hydroxylating ferredoxin subunit